MASDLEADPAVDPLTAIGDEPVPRPRTADGPRRDMLLAFWQNLRPSQWTKQVFVASTPLVAGVLGEARAWLHVLIAVAAFCLASSAGYLHNDIADVEADRLHPVKRYRPIASGRLPVRVARAASIVLGLAGIALGLFAVSWQLGLVVACYLGVTFAYTSYLKHIEVVDVVTVAACFVIRAIAGAVAVNVPVTHWFFIVATMGSLYLVSAKREAEHISMTETGLTSRASLQAYSVNYLATLRTVCLASLLASYIGWALARDSLDGSNVPWFALSVVPFTIAVLRYALRVDLGQGEEPEEIIRHDRPLLVAGIVVTVLVGLGTYVH
jgi:decaprenyl-phosphate phosphoribosyltransferase